MFALIRATAGTAIETGPKLDGSHGRWAIALDRDKRGRGGARPGRGPQGDFDRRRTGPTIHQEPRTGS